MKSMPRPALSRYLLAAALVSAACGSGSGPKDGPPRDDGGTSAQDAEAPSDDDADVTLDAGAEGGAVTPAHVVINEIESSGGNPGDFVELVNAGGESAELAGYVVKDADDAHVYVLPAGTVLAPGAHLVIEEASLGYGLGGGDAVRLFDTDGVLVDVHTWTEHAATTYGRCPDGTGPFTTTASPTKGTANTCTPPEPEGDFEPWPDVAAVQALDTAGTYGENLSDVVHVPAHGATPAMLFAVQNNPSRLHTRVEQAGAWIVDPAFPTGRALRYPNGSGSPDAEGLAVAEHDGGAVYVATERDNDAGTVSKLAILRFDVAGAGTTLTATHAWDLTAELGPVGPNVGVEAIAWVPDTYLVARGFHDAHANAAYDPTDYPDHGSGVFLVGLEGSDLVHVYVLDHETSTATRIGTFDVGLLGVMSLVFDRDVGYLWAHCDDLCANRSTVLEIEGAVGAPDHGAFVVRAGFERPATLGNSGYEGAAPAAEAACVAGTKPFFFADDAAMGGHALRMARVPCGPFL